MKVRLDISPDTEITVEKDESGNVLSILFEPTFAKSTGVAVLAYGVTKTDGGQVVDRFSLNVSGSTGRLGKSSRSAPVTSAIDEKHKKKENPDPSAEGKK